MHSVKKAVQMSFGKSFLQYGPTRSGRVALLAALLALVGCNDSGLIITDDELTADGQSDHINDEYWAELAQDYEAFVKPPELGAATPPTDWISLGRWDDTLDWPLIATGAANLPDGRVLGWSSTKVAGFGGTQHFTYGTVYDPDTSSFMDVPNATHNMFCAGVSMLEDGRVFLAGGGQTVSSVSVFENGEFTEVEPMSLPRWYPTSTTLPTGQVFTSLGTIQNYSPELWTEDQGWDLLTDLSLETIKEGGFFNHNDWYPSLNVAPDGGLFHPGHMPGLLSVYLDQENHITEYGTREDNEVSRLYGSVIMYDIGKMLIAGGGDDEDATNKALTIDLNGPTPVVTQIDSMKHRRSMQNTVVLPNGEVLVIGGNTSGLQFSDEGTVLEPELWNPETGTWRTLSYHDKPRNYHSTALLLKDARVLSAGGGLCGGCATNHQNGEIFSPPYLFDELGNPAPRPVISDAINTAFAGDTFELTGSDDIIKFNMVRLAAITHHHSTDQRLVPIDSVSLGDGSYQLTLNSNTNVLVPGYYWVFGLNEDGTPSEGHTLQIKVSAELQPTPVDDTQNAVTYEYYEIGLTAGVLPNFDALTPLKTGVQADFSLAEKERNTNFAFRFRAEIDAPAPGRYTFYLQSDDGSKLLIDGQEVVDNSVSAKFNDTKTGSITLSAGKHDIELQYSSAAGAYGLLASWEGPTFAKTPIESLDLGGPASEPYTGNNAIGPTVNGEINYQYYEGFWTSLPDFATLTPKAEGVVTGFDLSPKLRPNFYGFKYTGFIDVPRTATYTFYVTSNDGSRLSIDGVEVVNNDGVHTARERFGVMELTAGLHEIDVEYFQRAGASDLIVSWGSQFMARRPINSSELSSSLSAIVADDPDTGPSIRGQVSYKYYEGNWFFIPDFSDETVILEGEVDGFNLSPALSNDYFGIEYNAFLTIPWDGNYTFYISSDDGSRLFINDTEVVSNNGVHANRERSGSIALTAGTHRLKVEYFERKGGQALDVKWSGPLIAKQTIDLGALASDGSIPGNPGPSIAGQVSYKYYEGVWTAIPDFSNETVLKQGEIDAFDISPRLSNDNYGFEFNANLTIPASDDYTFYIASDDGSRLSINGDVVADNNGLHGYRQVSGTASLTTGTYQLKVEFFERSGRDRLDVLMSVAGAEPEPIDINALSSDGSVLPSDFLNQQDSLETIFSSSDLD